jgi:hypothetical protein
MMPALTVAPNYITIQTFRPVIDDIAFLEQGVGRYDDAELPTPVLYTILGDGHIEPSGSVEAEVSIALESDGRNRVLTGSTWIPSSDLDYASVLTSLNAYRNSEEEEWFAFDELKPLVEKHGESILRQLDATAKSREMRPMTRHYFAYMLSYIDGDLRERTLHMLREYFLSDDDALRTGAEEGLERLELV